MALPYQPSDQLVASVSRVIEGFFIIIPFPHFFFFKIHFTINSVSSSESYCSSLRGWEDLDGLLTCGKSFKA